MNLWVLDYRMKGIYEMKKGAFTLAEVLLTLAIIGVVAAMTVPSLMTSTEDKKLGAASKKAYNTLQNAITLKQAQTDMMPSDITTGMNIIQFLVGADKDKVPVLKVMDLSSDSKVVQTPDGIVMTADTNQCGDGEITSTTFCVVTVDVNGADGPNFHGAADSVTATGAVIKALKTSSPADYARATRDIVHFRVNNMNVYPDPTSGTAMRYIKGVKAK
ncbi:type II secretion system protein [bacterium]|nr:type II secretion system protein [bacterium]